MITMKRNNLLSVATIALLMMSNSLEAFDRSKLKCDVDKKLIGAAVGGVFTGIGLTCLVFKAIFSKEVVKEKPWPAGNSFEIDIPKKLNETEVKDLLKKNREELDKVLAKAKLDSQSVGNDLEYSSKVIISAFLLCYSKHNLPKSFVAQTFEYADTLTKKEHGIVQMDFVHAKAIEKILPHIKSAKLENIELFKV